MERNIHVFLSLNKEEKGLRKELVEKQVEVEFKEKYLKKMNVLQHHKHRKERMEESSNFVNSFVQAKNLIEKQMKIGKKIKDQKVIKQEKQELVSKMKGQRERDRSRDMQAVRSVLFDTGLENTSFSR